ncbi:MAG: amino acid ABC transporter permease [Desulfatibacillum sp.]|nr:amino acid ABC transporter permease [Desulfatibacillum sp.]
MLDYNFEWSILWSQTYGPWLLKGIWTTIHLSLLAWVIGSMLGLMVALARLAPYRVVRFAGGAYVQVFRNIPLLVQMFFWYFAVPALLPREMGRWLNHEVPHLGYYCGVVCLGTYTASRVAEVIRSGFLAVPKGVTMAALATGLSPWNTYRHVTIPYALRISMPLLSNEILSCFKNSALTMTIGVMETTGMAGLIDSFTFHGLETTTAASLVYLAITLCVVAAFARVEKKMRIPGLMERSN